MSARVSGYHYEVGADGKRHRVYENNKRGKPKAQQKAKARVFRGKGGYYDSGFVKTMNKAIPRGSFAKAGSMIAGPLGGYAGGLLSQIAGFGSYSVKKNSIISEGQSPPDMHSSNNTCVIRHREYIGDVVSSATANSFNNISYNIQPGDEITFPWLAPIAQQYQEYKVRGMVFEFKSLSADAVASSQANTALGGVIMATDYNPYNLAFSSKQEMENTQYTTSAKPSMSFYHPVECAMTTNPTNTLFVKGGGTAPGGDIRMYNLGTFQIATFGVAATSVVLGELWVTYEIEFSKPISIASTGATVVSGFWGLTGVDGTNTLGTANTPNAQNSLIGSLTSNTFYFGEGFNPNTNDQSNQRGKFLVYYSVYGTAAALNVPGSPVTFTNCALDSWYGSLDIYPITGVTSDRLAYVFVVDVNPTKAGAQASMRFNTITQPPTAITYAQLVITQIDSDFGGIPLPPTLVEGAKDRLGNLIVAKSKKKKSRLQDIKDFAKLPDDAIVDVRVAPLVSERAALSNQSLNVIDSYDNDEESDDEDDDGVKLIKEDYDRKLAEMQAKLDALLLTKQQPVKTEILLKQGK